jgi:hypothetical protein
LDVDEKVFALLIEAIEPGNAAREVTGFSRRRDGKQDPAHSVFRQQMRDAPAKHRTWARGLGNAVW